MFWGGKRGRGSLRLLRQMGLSENQKTRPPQQQKLLCIATSIGEETMKRQGVEATHRPARPRPNSSAGYSTVFVVEGPVRDVAAPRPPALTRGESNAHTLVTMKGNSRVAIWRKISLASFLTSRRRFIHRTLPRATR